mmetsp:Transcript_3072/g.9368  ORF Transcript_3072/g.9368 Transcript_3072/m.9368 type:complete len:237 (+) Transcript_3072:607-1317(+)
MQPMMAMVTPGRWPVRWEMVSVTSCRSKSVRPQLGQLTNSVLTLRMREPWSSPKLAVRRNSGSKGASTRTPSPRPSTKRDPPSKPRRRTKRSLRSTATFGGLADVASYASLWITGSLDPWLFRRWNTRRVACNREISAAGTSITTNDGFFCAPSERRAAVRSSSDSSPRTTTAVPITFFFSGASSPCAARKSARGFSRIALAGKSSESSSSSLFGGVARRGESSSRQRRAVRRCLQ